MRGAEQGTWKDFCLVVKFIFLFKLVFLWEPKEASFTVLSRPATFKMTAQNKVKIHAILFRQYKKSWLKPTWAIKLLWQPLCCLKETKIQHTLKKTSVLKGGRKLQRFSWSVLCSAFRVLSYGWSQDSTPELCTAENRCLLGSGCNCRDFSCAAIFRVTKC